MPDLLDDRVLQPNGASGQVWSLSRQRLGHSVVRNLADTTLTWPNGAAIDAVRKRNSATAAMSDMGSIRATDVMCTVLQVDCVGQAVTHGSPCTLGDVPMLIRDVARIDDLGQFVLLLEQAS